MEENENQNQNQNKQSEFKQETRNTVNTAKEQMKNFNFKEEAEAGKGLIKRLWTDPVNAVKEIVLDGENKFFKTSIVFIVVWLVLILLYDVIYYARSEYLDMEFLPTLKKLLAPVLGVVAMVASIFVLNKNSKKSFVTLISTIVTVRIPLIISELISYLLLISSNAGYITSPISKILNIVSVVLTFFAVKFSFEEEDNAKAFKSFVLVEGVYCIIYFVLRFLGIYID